MSVNKVKRTELVVITETKRLIDNVFLITEKSPKKFRYSFTTKIHSLLIEIIELFYLANALDVRDEERSKKQDQEVLNNKFIYYRNYLLKGNNYMYYMNLYLGSIKPLMV